MGDPLTLGLILGAGGVAKSELVDAPKAAKQNALATATARYAPWTGLKAGPTQYADPLGQGMQYGVTGALLGLANKGKGTPAIADPTSTDAVGLSMNGPQVPGVGAGSDINDLSGASTTAPQSSLGLWDNLAKKARMINPGQTPEYNNF